MEHAKVNINMPTFGKGVEAYVRSRAIQMGSFIIYEENGKIIKEDPRSGKKTVVRPAKNN